MTSWQTPDLTAYDIEVTRTGAGKLFATVRELPGCVAAGETVRELEEAIRQAIIIFLDDHPKAPARWCPSPSSLARASGPGLM